MPEQSESYKVVDKRKFDEKGNPKPETEQQPEQVTAEESQEKEKPQDQSGPEATPGRGKQEIDLGAFILSLSTTALINLGQIPDPVAKEKKVRLREAQEIIDIIAMLQSKTVGNLTREEETIFEQVLYELRMQFLVASKAVKI